MLFIWIRNVIIQHIIGPKPVSTCRGQPVGAGRGWRQRSRLQSELAWTQYDLLLQNTKGVNFFFYVSLYEKLKINHRHVLQWHTMLEDSAKLSNMIAGHAFHCDITTRWWRQVEVFDNVLVIVLPGCVSVRSLGGGEIVAPAQQQINSVIERIHWKEPAGGTVGLRFRKARTFFGLQGRCTRRLRVQDIQSCYRSACCSLHWWRHLENLRHFKHT